MKYEPQSGTNGAVTIEPTDIVRLKPEKGGCRPLTIKRTRIGMGLPKYEYWNDAYGWRPLGKLYPDVAKMFAPITTGDNRSDS